MSTCRPTFLRCRYEDLLVLRIYEEHAAIYINDVERSAVKMINALLDVKMHGAACKSREYRNGFSIT